MTARAKDFIRQKIDADIASGKYGGRVVTRFPPEPNGYLHIGHAKSICLNFGLAADYGGVCHLRYDDTNPETEDPEYVEAIARDLRWLGFEPGDKVFYASDYAPQLRAYAVRLIEKGLAYVCDLSEDDIRATRGTVTEPGTRSPFAGRSVAENLDLFARMHQGEFPEGARVLRARIDMASPNMKMRDPLLYRIKHTPHYRTGTASFVYPFYDFAHCLSDAIEGITHSICTLEFDNNRELYDWILAALDIPTPPEQTEFARLNVTYFMMSKRRLLQLVQEHGVEGWDDPRMPTLAGLRRRGVRPEALRAFAERVGVARANSIVEIELFEDTLRDDLSPVSPRVMAVAEPLELVIENLPAGHAESFDAPLWPKDIPQEGRRPVPFGRRLLIERGDFAVAPPPGFHRLSPGAEVRLKYAYVVRCTRVEHGPDGAVVRVFAEADLDTRGGRAPAGRKVKGTIHWVDAATAVPAEIRLYDRLFTAPAPGAERDWKDDLNPDSLVVRAGFIEPWAAALPGGSRVQLERAGYFFVDPVLAAAGRFVLNKVVGLKESWSARASEPAVGAPAPRDEAAEAPTEKAPVAAALSPAAAAFVARGVGAEEARVLAQDDALAAFFEAVVGAGLGADAAAPLVVHELRALAKGRPVGAWAASPGALVAVREKQAAGALTGPAAREVLSVLLAEGGDVDAIVTARGLGALTDEGPVRAAVAAALAAAPDRVAAYKSGRTGLAGYFVGVVMKSTGGRADPALVQRLVAAALDG